MSNTTVRLQNPTDTYVNQAFPSANFNGRNTVALRHGGTGEVYGNIYFARTFPMGATIVSAKLNFRQTAAWSGTTTIVAKRITGTWSASKVTWNNKPAVTTTNQVTMTKTDTANGTVWTMDVTALMQAVSDGGAYYGIRLELTSPTAVLREVFSSQYASNSAVRPTMDITWSTAPDKPSTLTPNGGVISQAKPTLRFDFTDTAGSTSMAAYQVQLNTSNSWTTPLLDTGEVASTVPQCDLAGTSYAGLAVGSTLYWRVRVKDGDGQWSAWSDTASFSRQNKGTLTITNPTATLSDPSPTVTWTFTGATQESWEVFLENTSGGQLYKSGQTTNTSTSWTIPAGYIKRNNQSVVVRVRVWDTYDRVTAVGDPTYVDATVTSTFDYNAAVPKPTSVTVSQYQESPAVQIQWNAASSPTMFHVLRDGVRIQDLDPASVYVSGTTYSWIDKMVQGYKPHTYTIESVVDGLGNGSNPSASITVKPSGIWILDTDGDNLIRLLGDDAGTWDMPELAGVYSPIGATKSSRVLQAQRGYEGSLTGEIHELNGLSVDAQVQALYAIKKAPSKQYIIVLSDIAFPAILGNITVKPNPNREVYKTVTFDFWSQTTFSDDDEV